MWHSIKVGLFIGVTISSLVIFILRIVPMTSLIMIIILYTYAVVGVLTAFFLYKRFEKKMSELKLNTDISSKLSIDRLDPNITNDLRSLVMIIKNAIRIQNQLEILREENKELIKCTIDKMKKKVSMRD